MIPETLIREVLKGYINLLSRQSKATRLFIETLAVFLLIGAFIGIVLTLKDETVNIFGYKTSVIQVIVIAITTLGGASAILSYIENGPRNATQDSAKAKSSAYIRIIEEKLRGDTLEIIRKAGNAQGISQDIEQTVKSKIDELLESKLDEKINKKYSKKAVRLYYSRLVDSQAKELQSGINIQIGKLSRSATINLLIGLATTIIAISVLLSLVLDAKDKSFANIGEMVPYLIPRTVLSIFIEVFSFFFLRLYRDNLEDVKYFQNERTNIDAKIIALKSAVSFGGKEELAEVIKSFLAVERNFVLKKDETTINIERVKMSNQQEFELLTKITDLLNKNRKD